jgi:hypothetical protein
MGGALSSVAVSTGLTGDGTTLSPINYDFNSLTNKATPADNDILIIADSADSNNPKKILKSSLGGAALTNWTESNYLYNTKYGVKFTPNSAQTNVFAVIQPKGNGGIIAQQPDGTATGGNNRGNYAVDLQTARASAGQVASGSNSFIGGGVNNTAGGNYSAIAGGFGNTVSGDSNVSGGGESNSIASSQRAVICGGYSNSMNGGDNSVICGGTSNVNTASFTSNGGGYAQRLYLYGQSNEGGANQLAATKKRQTTKLTWQKQTTDATANVEMFLDNSSARAVLPDNTSWAVELMITAHHSSQVYSCKYARQLIIYRGAGVGTTALEGAVQTIGTDIENTNLSACNIAVTADTTNGSIKIAVTGLAATTINWQAYARITEIEN